MKAAQFFRSRSFGKQHQTPVSQFWVPQVRILLRQRNKHPIGKPCCKPRRAKVYQGKHAKSFGIAINEINKQGGEENGFVCQTVAIGLFVLPAQRKGTIDGLLHSGQTGRPFRLARNVEKDARITDLAFSPNQALRHDVARAVAEKSQQPTLDPRGRPRPSVPK